MNDDASALPVERIGDGEASLRAITDALPVLVSFVDADRRYRFVNAAYERWFGHRKEELLGKSLEEVLGRDAYEAILPHVERALRGETVTYQAEIPYHVGGRRAVEATYIPLTGTGGKIDGFVALVNDTTEKLALERFRDVAIDRAVRLLKITSAIANAVTEADVFEALVDRVADAIDARSAALFLLSEDRQTVRLARAFGYSQGARDAIAVLPVDSRPAIPALDAVRRGEPIWIPSKAELFAQYPHLEPIADAAQSYRIACMPLLSQQHAVGALAFTFADERHSTEEERAFLLVIANYASQALERLRLLEAERRSRVRAEQLYRFAQVVVGAKHIDVVYEAAMAAVDVALDVTRSAILTVDHEGVMRFRAWRGLSDEYRQAVEGHSPWLLDAPGPAPVLVSDTRRDPALAMLAPILAREGIGAVAFFPLVAEGRLLGKFTIYHSTEHAFTTAEIETAEVIANYLASMIGRFSAIAKLEDTIRYNELFTGVLAHDLRNPLGAIMMAGQLMLQLTEDDRLLKPLHRITRSGERMSRMIDQLLDFTQARLGGGIPVTRKPANLELIAKQAIDEIELMTTGWTFELHAIGDLLGEWDADRIAQVFSNLAGNAVQHGSPESPLVFRLDGSRPESVTVEIRNRGVVQPEILPSIFEPFRTTHQKRDGTKSLGLGLYITQEVVRAHSGSISVTSSEADGTAFRITMPRGRERRFEPVTGVSSQPGTRDSGRWHVRPPLVSAESAPSDERPVFIVDDDRDIREALTETLEDRGMAVITAKNGREALELLRSAKAQPSAILLDLMMPIMDGYRFLEEKRRDPALARIPVAVITAGHGVDHARLGESVRVVAKPIDVPALISTLRELRAESRG